MVHRDDGSREVEHGTVRPHLVRKPMQCIGRALDLEAGQVLVEKDDICSVGAVEQTDFLKD
jgi:hypothetical protein